MSSPLVSGLLPGGRGGEAYRVPGESATWAPRPAWGRGLTSSGAGGTGGVLSPHATVFPRSAMTERSGGSAGPRLALAVEATRDIAAEEVGTMAQVREVAAAVRRCLQAAEIRDPADVHYVQVKGPLLTPASIADADRRGAKLVTHDPNGSKVYARGATALRVELGLGEGEERSLPEESIGTHFVLYS